MEEKLAADGAFHERRRTTEFRAEIQTAINRCSAENGSNTPDFILAAYLISCLAAYDRAVTARERWYGRAPVAVGGPEPELNCPPMPPIDPPGHPDNPILS